MKTSLVSFGFIPFFSFAVCEWTPKALIPNNDIVAFQECKAQKSIRLNEFIIRPHIEFEIVHEHYPEGNTIWSAVSPDENLVLVWLENSQYERELWILDLSENEVSFNLSSMAEGRHFSAQFINNSSFLVTISGMGYKNEMVYFRKSGNWVRQFIDASSIPVLVAVFSFFPMVSDLEDTLLEIQLQTQDNDGGQKTAALINSFVKFAQIYPTNFELSKSQVMAI